MKHKNEKKGDDYFKDILINVTVNPIYNRTRETLCC